MFRFQVTHLQSFERARACFQRFMPALPAANIVILASQRSSVRSWDLHFWLTPMILKSAPVLPLRSRLSPFYQPLKLSGLLQHMAVHLRWDFSLAVPYCIFEFVIQLVNQPKLAIRFQIGHVLDELYSIKAFRSCLLKL